MDLVVSYLRDKKLPDNKDEARKIRLNSARYVILGDVLYKSGYSLPYLRCLTSDEVNYMMREIHEGICGTIWVQGRWPITPFAKGTFGLP